MFNNNPEHLIGQQLGSYRLTKFLKGGGFGFVYQAEHIKLQKTVAIKLLKPEHVREVGYVEAFEREAKLIASLTHPHILDIHHYDIFEDAPYIVMPFIERGSLRTVHPDGIILDPTTLLSYVKQVASALQYAHDRKIVHRDIKPDNFLLGPQGVLLSDFGIAITAHGFDSMTWQTVGGSAPYMAPEQYEHKAQIWSDQYSLAVVIYKWLSGKLPFYGNTTFELFLKHKNEMPPWFKQQGVDIPSNVEQVVRKGLAKDPHARYLTVTEFAQRLEKAILESQAKLRTSQETKKELQSMPTHGNNGRIAGPDPIALSPQRDKPTVKLPAEPAAVAPIVVPLLVTPQRRNIGKTSTVAAGVAPVGAGVAAVNYGGEAVVPYKRSRKTAHGNNNVSRPLRRGNILLLGIALFLLALLLLYSGLAHAYPGTLQNTLGAVLHLFSPSSASNEITITPKNQVVSHGYTIVAINGTPSTNPQDKQIKAFPLSYTTPATTSQPVPTTGVNNTSGTPAHGTLTLTNTTASPYTFGIQTPIVSNSGITVHLDAPITIPASDLVNGIVGRATMTATTATGGVNANIHAGDINTTASNNPIRIENKAPFTGGQDAQHYNFATQADVNTAAASLQTSLKQQAQSALQTKATADQPLANNITCTPKVTPDQPIGDTGTAVNSLTVTVTATCNAVAYDAKGLRTLMGTLLQEQANTDLGQGYTLRGILRTQVTVVDVSADGSAANLNVNAQGRYTYNLDNQVSALKTLIKGLSVEKARTALLGQAGVMGVQFPNGTTTMPTDVSQITITVAYPQGFTTSGGPTGAPTPTPAGANG